RAEGERPRAGGLRAPRRVGAQVLELLDDAEAAGRRLDAPRRLVARLLVVAPRAGLPAHGQGSDALDDRVVGVHVPVEAAHLAVRDDVEPGLVHVADRGIGGVVEHLLEVARPVLAGLVGLDRGEPPAGLAVGSDDGRRDQGEIWHEYAPVAREVVITT